MKLTRAGEFLEEAVSCASPAFSVVKLQLLASGLIVRSRAVNLIGGDGGSGAALI